MKRKERKEIRAKGEAFAESLVRRAKRERGKREERVSSSASFGTGRGGERGRGESNLQSAEQSQGPAAPQKKGKQGTVLVFVFSF